MKVRALKKHSYGGKLRPKDTEYFIENVNHVKILKVAKAITIVKETIDIKKPVEPKPIKKVKQEFKKIPKERSRFYSRKDMQAEHTKNPSLKRGKNEKETIKD